MASSSNSTMTLQQHRPRPTVARKVVPAIPLPFIHKRRQQDAALARAREQPEILSSVEQQEVQVVPTPLSPTPPASETSPTAVNDFVTHEAEVFQSTMEASPPKTPAMLATPPTEEDVEEATVVEETSNSEESADIIIDTPRSQPSDGQSSTSRSTYQMPPPFVPQHPANSTYPIHIAVPQSDIANGHSPTNHGDLTVGASDYPASNSSSPALPISAGSRPPYPYHQHPQAFVGRHASHPSNGGHSRQMSSGFMPVRAPPPGYYPHPDVFMNPTLPAPEHFDRGQMLPNRPAVNYSPAGENSGNGYPPPTAQSFHGSQSSVNFDHENRAPFYGQHPTAVISNGSNGQISSVALIDSTRPGSQPLWSGIPVQPDHLDGLTNYIQSMFGDRATADTILVLSFADGRLPNAQFPGHKLIFGRSPFLRRIIQELPIDPRSGFPESRDLDVEARSRFLTPQGFWFALQRLYGHPLINQNVCERPDPRNMIPNSNAECVDLALSYAASGRLLNMDSVTDRGIELTARFLDLQTMKEALDFAYDTGYGSQWIDRKGQPGIYGYGSMSDALVKSCLNLMMANMPEPNMLDAFISALRTVSYNDRLPAVTDIRAPSKNIASNNPRLSKIMFGDHQTEETTEQKQVSDNLAIMARVYLNLPFAPLKSILDSMNRAELWIDPSARRALMIAIIDEREKRRIQVYESNTSSTERLANSIFWEPVGWAEQVTIVESGEMATITREWVNFTYPPTAQ